MRTMIRLQKLHLNISIFAFLAVLALFYANLSIYTICIFAAAFLHEMGHLCAMKLTGTKIIETSIYPFGIDIKVDNSKINYRKEMFISLSGPIVNFVFALISYIILCLFFSRELMFFFFANLALGFVNIMPIKVLDGGRTLENFLCNKFSLETSLKICEITSAVSFAILTIFALLVLSVTNYNTSLLIFCAYLFICVYANEKNCKQLV